MGEISAYRAAFEEGKAVWEDDGGDFAPGMAGYVLGSLSFWGVSLGKEKKKKASRGQTYTLLALREIEQDQVVVGDTALGEDQSDAVSVGRAWGPV